MNVYKFNRTILICVDNNYYQNQFLCGLETDDNLAFGIGDYKTKNMFRSYLILKRRNFLVNKLLTCNISSSISVTIRVLSTNIL